jgi:hypothetical protein
MLYVAAVVVVYAEVVGDNPLLWKTPVLWRRRVTTLKEVEDWESDDPRGENCP